MPVTVAPRVDGGVRQLVGRRSGSLVAAVALVVSLTGASSGVPEEVPSAGTSAATSDLPQQEPAVVAVPLPNAWARGLLSAPENFWAVQLLALLVVEPAGADDPAATASGLTAEQAAIDPRVDVKGIPARVLEAYRAAAARLAEEQPGCGMRWELIAGIGRVESGHGTFRGATVDTNGRITPEIIGLRLDGAGPVAEIRDTDGGRLDHDVEFDRAVGPMQFIPGTWAGTRADGDGDGRSDPHDIDDAALGAGRYLCAAGSVGAPAGKVRAVYSYNHSFDYVRLVLTLAASYAGVAPESFGTGLLPPPAAPGPVLPPPPPAPLAPAPVPGAVPPPGPPAPAVPAPAAPVPEAAPAPATPKPSTAPAPADPPPADPPEQPTPSSSPSPTHEPSVKPSPSTPPADSRSSEAPGPTT